VTKLTADGFEAEIAIPRAGRNKVSMNLIVASRRGKTTTVYSLAQRRNPFNPRTFAEVSLAK
jgi:hypothetical protein